jgi:hypothetical protein
LNHQVQSLEYVEASQELVTTEFYPEVIIIHLVQITMDCAVQVMVYLLSTLQLSTYAEQVYNHRPLLYLTSLLIDGHGSVNEHNEIAKPVQQTKQSNLSDLDNVKHIHDEQLLYVQNLNFYVLYEAE